MKMQTPIEQRVESLEARVHELEKIIVAIARGEQWTITSNGLTTAGHVLPIIMRPSSQ